MRVEDEEYCEDDFDKEYDWIQLLAIGDMMGSLERLGIEKIIT